MSKACKGKFKNWKENKWFCRKEMTKKSEWENIQGQTIIQNRRNLRTRKKKWKRRDIKWFILTKKQCARLIRMVPEPKRYGVTQSSRDVVAICQDFDTSQQTTSPFRRLCPAPDNRKVCGIDEFLDRVVFRSRTEVSPWHLGRRHQEKTYQLWCSRIPVQWVVPLVEDATRCKK